jgi:hypothetical protein
MFTFCPLQGALSDSSASQSLLELDGGVKVLVDLGWDESFDVEKLKEIEKYALLRTPWPRRLLILVFQTSHDSISNSRYTCDSFASRRLRPLLQEHSSVHAHPRVCDTACH